MDGHYYNMLELASRRRPAAAIEYRQQSFRNVRHPISLLVTCCLLSIATAPFFINWIPFEHLLEREGVYSVLCSTNSKEGMPWPKLAEDASRNIADEQDGSCVKRRSAFILLEESSIAASYVFASIGGFAYEK